MSISKMLTGLCEVPAYPREKLSNRGSLFEVVLRVKFGIIIFGRLHPLVMIATDSNR